MAPILRFSPSMQKPVCVVLTWILVSITWLTPLSWGAEAFTPQIHATTLASGHQVYIQEIHTQPIVTIDTWVNTGSAQETPHNNGVSHFLEHLLFKGTPKHPLGEIDKLLESRGAVFNAATSDDFTHYHITTATPYYREALELHADMLLNASINTPELDRERHVVQEEINRALDNPSRKLFIQFNRLMYGNHPYALDTLGPKANIQNLSREEILDYYHRWYQPENFKTVIVGDVDPAEALTAVKEAFENAYNEQSRPKAETPRLNPVAPLEQSRTAVLTDPNLSANHWILGFQAPPVEDRQANYALDIAAMVLGKGASSRLNHRIREQQQLVSSIGAGNSTQQQAGAFYIYAQLKPENRQAAVKAILDELARFKAQGPTQDEMQKAKTQVIKDFAFSTESTEGVASTIGYNVTIATLEDYTQYVSNLQNVTAEDVKKAVNQYLRFDRAVLVEALPEKNVTASAVSAMEKENLALLSAMAANPVARASATDAKKASTGEATTSDGVTKTVLANGTTLLMKPSPSTQTVALSIFARGGRLAEPRPGVSAMTARLLTRGTQSRTSHEIREQLESLGLTLGVTSAEDYFQVSAASVSTDLAHLLLMLEDVLTRPTFPQDELEKERKLMLHELQTSRDHPSNLMVEKLTEALYPDHPYGYVGQKLEETLPHITREDVQRYYRHQMQPENLVIAVAGNFDPAWMKSGLEQIVVQLPADPANDILTTTLPNVKPLPADKMVETGKPEQADAWIAYGWLAPDIANTRDYTALKLINTLLGSGLSSRLFVNLREKQGLAYNVSSSYPSTLKNGRFMMFIGTDPKNIDKALAGFNSEIRRLQQEPLSDEELENTKSRLIGLFALAHETNANQAFYLGFYETLGVGYGFDAEYPHIIRRITAQDIQRVAQTYLNRPRVTTIVAPKTVRTETEAYEHHGASH